MNYVTTQKERDKAVILNVVRSFGSISRVEIHRLTHLRTSTISQLTRELLEEGHIKPAGRSDNPSGRKQLLLKINEQRGFLLGLEFDAEFVTAGVMDLKPAIRAVVKHPTDCSRGSRGLLSQLKDCAHQALREARVSPAGLLGVGVADIGLVNRRTGVSIMSSQLDFWRDVPLAATFEEEFRVPVMVDNATRCRGNAERLLGSGASNDNMIYVEYGAGIGSAIFSAGRVVEGHRTGAGEFGHTRVASSPIPCKCGSFGCLEALAAAPALANRFREIIREGGASMALTLAGDESRVTGWHVLEAARLGDKVCLLIADEMARHLAVGLGNLVNLLDPACIVLDQRLSICGPDFLEQLRRSIRLQALSHMVEDLVVCYGSLAEEAGVLGAGLLCLEELFAIPELKPPHFLVAPEPVSWRR